MHLVIRSSYGWYNYSICGDGQLRNGSGGFAMQFLVPGGAGEWGRCGGRVCVAMRCDHI